MSDARERIAVAVDEYGAWPGNTEPVVSEILAIVKEALLSEADGYIVAKGGDGEAEGAFATKPWMEMILQDAFGADDDEGER